MTTLNKQVVTAFEDLGMSPEEIAQSEDFNMDLLTVKAILMQFSSLYRKESKNDAALQFSDGEAEECKDIILNIARYTEDEHLQFKAASFILNDKKGRLDDGRMLAKMRDNPAILVNIHLTKALQARERTVQKAVEIQSEKVLQTVESERAE